MSARLLRRALFAVLLIEVCAVVGLFTKADDLGVQDDEEKSYGTEINTPLIGDYTTFGGMSPIMVEGVGLVTGLNGTGGDPAPSIHRTLLLEDMKKRGVKNPNAILQSPDTALVIVRAYLPPTIKPGDNIDAEVVIPESAEATSLEGGWLMEVELEEHIVAGSQLKTGHVFAKVKGPILVPGATVGASDRKGGSNLQLRKGRVLGGATVVRKRELAIFLRSDYRSVRNSTRIAEAIGRRFHHFDQYGSKKAMAEATTDQKLTLEIHPRYKDNYPRYLQVIRHIAFRETQLNQRLRMQRLHDELLVGETADRAALQLEAIGKEAIPILQTGLKSPILECRFHAAMALAYLEEPSAIPVLAEAAREERAFRVFALAGLSAMDDAQSHLALRELMSEQSAETRYGSFRALWTLDKNDPFIRGEEMALDPPDPDSNRKSSRGLWKLHVLDTSGDPMVHCTLRTRPEVVLFGAQQELTTPLALTVGPRIVVTAQTGSDKVQVTRFEPNRPDQRREIPLQVAALIRAVDELGATYPEVVQMLTQSAQQRNLAGRFETDALPESGRVYIRPASSTSRGGKATIGKKHLAPNIYERFGEDEPTTKDDLSSRDRTSKSATNGMASVSEEKNARKTSDQDEKKRNWNPFARSKSAEKK